MKILKTSLAGILSLLVYSIGFSAPPSPPQNLQQAFLDSFESLLLWEEVPGATSYSVYRADESNTWSVVTSGLTQPRWRDRSWQLLPSFYVVTALNSDGEGPVSDIAAVNYAWGYTIWLNELHAWYGNVTPTNATVNWTTSNPNGDQGIVEWGAAEPDATNFNFFVINTNYLPWHTFILTNLTPATFYNYRVTSISSNRGGVTVTRAFSTPDTNHAPVITYLIPYPGTPVGIQFWITDTDQPPQNITFQISQPALGTLSGPWQQWAPEGMSWGMWYQPYEGARGLDSFTILADDGVESSAPATITVSNWLNRLPEVTYVYTNVVEDTPTTIHLPVFDADGDALTFDVFYSYGGTVSGTGPNFLFTPDTNRTGDASIYYFVSDGYGTVNGYVQINLTPVNDRPTAYPASFTTGEEQTVTTWLNWSDVEYGVPMTAVIVRPPAHGTVSGEIWQMQYTPETNFYGEDSFDFVIREEDGTTSDPATITIQVNGLNDPPNVPAETFYTREDTAVSFAVGATDVEGDPLIYWINSGPSHGTLTGTLPNLTYTPAPGYFGFDAFNYTASDPYPISGTVTIGVGANSLPQPTLRRHIFEDGIVRLTWNDLGAQHYNVYRADGTNAPFTLLASNVVATNFNDETAQWQQPYWYRVRSWDGTNEGQPSATKFAYPDETGLLNLNQMNWVFGGTTGRVSFYYSLESGIEAMFEYGTNRNYGITLENTNLLPTQVFSLAGLTPGTVYYFRITTTDANGNSLVASTNLFQDWFVTQPRPIADSQSISLAEDTSGAVTPAGSDANGRPLTFSLVSNPAHGTVSIVTVSGGYYYFYVPVLNYFGSDAFTYKANNGELDSLAATVSITVTPVNDAPVASNQSIVMAEDTSRNLVLTGTDVEGGALTYQIIQSPTNGTFIAGTPPNLTYRLATNYFGTDSFQFTVQDSQFVTATGTVSITITNINDRPTALAQSLSLPEDSSLVIGASGIDPEGDILQLIILTLPTNGTLSLYTTQTVLYTPNTNFSGADGFQVRVSDGKLTSLVTVPVNITVTAANDRPTANPQNVSTPEDTAKAITLTGTDVEGSPLTYQITSGPTHGTLSGSGATRTYTPHANYVGSDQFNFVANDGTTNSAAVTVSITVTAVNDAPFPQWQVITNYEDISFSITLTGTDVDGDPLTFGVATQPYFGTLSGTPPNLFYRPNTNFNSGSPIAVADFILFWVSDGSITTSNGITIILLPVNDAPVALNQSYNVPEDGLVLGTFAGTDVETNALTFRVVTAPAYGSVTLFSSNSFEYRPNLNYTGSDSFSVVANDGAADSAPATISLTIAGSNDAPAVTNQDITISEDGVAVIVPLASDPDGDAITFVVVTAPLNGTVEFNGSNFVYTPFANYNGTDSFDYAASDNFGGTNTATVSITVSAVNDAPVAASQSISTAEDTAVNIGLAATDVEGASLTLRILNQPTNGVLSGTIPNLTYTPNAEFNGNDAFTFTANDGDTDGNTATVTISVTAVNDPPVAYAQSVTVAEDQSVAITLSGSDPEGSSLYYMVPGYPAHGSLSGIQANRIYTPVPNYFGTDTITFQVFDGVNQSAEATVTITITPVPDAPVVSSRNLTTPEDTALAITLPATDWDLDPLTISIIGEPSHGVVTGTGRDVIYTPNADFNGTDSFTYQANDGTFDSNIGTISINVIAVADAPAANAQTVTTAEDTAANITLTGSDPDGNTLSYSIVSGPTNGTLSGTAPNLIYTPNANFNGADAFLFSLSDGTTNATAVVTINVFPVNDEPTAVAQTVTVAEDSFIAVTLAGTDADGDAVSFAVVTGPAHGSLSGGGATLTYTPNANYNGSDSFTFTANDGTVESAPATVAITITPVNDRPVPANTTVTLAEDTSATVTLTGSDVEDSPLAFTLWSLPQHGTITGTAPNLTYTPNANFNGSDSLQFIVSDGSQWATGIVSLVITPVNDAPVAADRSITLNEDWILTTGVSATDIDGDARTYRVVSSPSGTLNFSQNGSFSYRGPTNYNGMDSFTFVANDGTTDGNIATVTITLTPMNDMPSVTNQAAATAEDTTVAISPWASDLDGDTLAFTVTTAPANGSVVWNGSAFAYTPDPNYNGTDSFGYRAEDPTGGSDMATITVTISPVNDSPVAAAQSVAVNEDNSLAITLAGSDVENSALTFTILNSPAHGTLSGTAPNVVYTPVANYNGPDSFTFSVNDGTVSSAPVTVSVSVGAINDAPAASNQSVTTAEDSSSAITLTGFDVDGDALTFTVVSSPGSGTLSGTAPNLTYTPAANFNGAVSFTFRVNDGVANSTTATVNINVMAVNDAPIANPQSVTVTYNSAKPITLSGSDLEGSALTYTIVTTPTNGTLSGTAPNVTYTPTVGSAGADRFTFRVNDGGSNSAPATVSITTLNPSGIPNAPTSLTVTVPTAIRTLILNWSCTATNEDGFKIERSLNGSSGWSQIATTGINIHTFTNTGLTSNTRYYYRVRSYNRLGNSAYSNTVNAKPR